ncbi:CDP-alcohol phosphatidyltransferase family protein [Candidatus Saccharibacteria bacterium]|nr:MAG: CDP-alcohol phosphatidyltransferase family protein [Candidatus Saccharibacteria bacterium]
MKFIVDAVKTAIIRVVHDVAVALNALSKGKISPNGVTWFGFLMHLPIAYFIIDGQLVKAGALLIFFGLFDKLDGELARLQKRVTNNGGFLDASTDRFKEVILYGGIAWYFAQGSHPEYAAIAAVACGASICVSYVKAKGEAVVASLEKKIPYPELNKMFSGGLFPFEIRMTVLIVGLLFNQLLWAVAAIAIFSAITALNRMIIISRRIS